MTNRFEWMEDQPPESAVFESIDLEFDPSDQSKPPNPVAILSLGGKELLYAIPPNIADKVVRCEKRETGYLLDPPKCVVETKWFWVKGRLAC